ncbi:MAG: CRISPR-associated helicase Cas3' [Deltaproteobacteria bacterium]|nr:CRISPR-associated helicase Cas3' [Deltaproteobacteria bacterium]
MDIETYYLKAMGAEFKPNPLQKRVWEAYDQAGGYPALLIKAGTGTGKTEAALLPALSDQRRVVMVLPSKALIEDMGQRIVKIGESLTAGSDDKLGITIDMGGSCRRHFCRDGKSEFNYYHRHLFADDIILTTLDKFLFRVFGYGEKIKSFIFPHRIFGSALGKKPFIIFDEAHDYDKLAYTNFQKLVEALYTKGKDLCVMSATLPEEFADFLTLVDAGQEPLHEELAHFQSESLQMVHTHKHLELVSASGDGDSLVDAVAQQVRNNYRFGERVIVRTETIEKLIKLYDKLVDFSPLVYHGRLTSEQRRGVINKIIDHQKNDKGFMILATSAIEAGCDLDAHLIITEFCDPDSLVQLAGRLNRRGRMPEAKIIVVRGESGYPFSTLSKSQQAAYWADLEGMNGLLEPVRLTDYFEPPQDDWMGEILFDMLWDYVYDGDLTCKPLWDRGILVTRSWEPSITLCTGINEETGRPENPIQVGLSRLTKDWPRLSPEDLKVACVGDYLSIANGDYHAQVKRVFYQRRRGEGGGWSIYDLPSYRISAYENTLLCIIREDVKDTYFDRVLGYKKLPKIFLKGYKYGYQRVLQYQPEQKKDGCFKLNNDRIVATGNLWYLER